MPIDSPRLGFGGLSEVPEEPSSPRPPVASGSRQGPYSNPSLSRSQSTFRAQPSSNSLASLASASATGSPVASPPLPLSSAARPSASRNLSNLRVASSASLKGDRDKTSLESDTASATGISVSGVMGVSTPVAGNNSKGRSKSPGSATVREKDASSSSGKEGRAVATKGSRAPVTQNGNRVRLNPHLPVGNADPVPATLMYWSKAPVYGAMPTHPLRAHSATLVDGMIWIFGGCDEKACWKDVWCFNTETMQWSNPATIGDLPPPCRAHTATLVDKKLVIFGGGEGPVYYNEVYVLDTVTRVWQHPTFGSPTSPPGTPSAGNTEGHPPSIPPPRRAHTAVLYRGRIWVFGGGNGTQALNDLWTLEVGNNASVEKMKWELMKTEGKMPSPRGYHTANLIGNVMVVVGGSDGRECFSDIWCLNLDTLQWSQVKLNTGYRRLSHSATQIGSYLFIWGGHNGSSYTSELLLFNLVALNFENRAPAGRPPSARAYHAAILTDSRLFVFGGFNGNDVYDDVYILDLAGAAYLPQVTSFRIDVD